MSTFLRAFRLLNLKRLRAHPLRAVVATLSVAAGVSLAVSVVVVRDSIEHSVIGARLSFAGPADFQVGGPAMRGGLAAETLPRLRSVEGVEAAVPMIRAITPITAADGRERLIVAIGFDCSVEALIGSFGCSPGMIEEADSDVALVSARLRRDLGEDLRIGTDLGPRELRGPTVSELDDVNSGLVVAYPMPVAQRLFARPDMYDAVYVVARPDADLETLRARIERAAGEHNLVLAASDPPTGLANFLVLVPLLGITSLAALAVGATLVYNTLSLSLAERRRDLAVASALGGTRFTLLAGTLAEAVVLGSVGGVLGSVAGVALAPAVLSGFRVQLQRIAGGDITVHAPWGLYAMGLLLGAAVSVLAATGPARRALRVDVVAALRARGSASSDPTAVPSIRGALVSTAVGGAGIIASHAAVAGGGLAAWQPIVGAFAMLLVSVGLFLAAGQIAPWLLYRLKSRLPNRARTLGLAFTNLAREPGRTVIMVVATSAAVGMAFTIASLGWMVRQGVTQSRIDEQKGGVWVSTLPRNNSINIDAKLPPALVERLLTFPGVASSGAGFAMGIATGDGPMLGVAASRYLTRDGTHLDPPFPFTVLRGTADPERFERGEVLIGATLARDRAVRPGDTLTLPGLHGMVDVRVQGVWANGDFNGNEISVPTWLAERIWGPQPVEGMSLIPAPGTSAFELARRIEDADLHPDLVAATPAELRRDTASDLNSFLAPFWALQRAMLAIAFTAVLFTLLLAAVQRRREMGLLAAVGLAPSGLARLVLSEGIIVAACGTVLGALAGAGLVDAFRNVFFLTVPYELPLLYDFGALAAYGALAVVILAAAAAWPAWQTSRLNVVDALRYE